jgi:hypothetical protein
VLLRHLQQAAGVASAVGDVAAGEIRWAAAAQRRWATRFANMHNRSAHHARASQFQLDKSPPFKHTHWRALSHTSSSSQLWGKSFEVDSP